MTGGAQEPLPDGWTAVSLGEVTEDVESVDPRKAPADEFSYVDISSIDNQDLVVRETKRIVGAAAPSRARRPVEPGDVVFSNVRTYLRNVARIERTPKPAIASTGFTVLRPTPAITTDYLFRLVASDAFIGLVTPKQTGTHYPATSDRVVRQQLVPLPPIAEQHRIAARLEEIAARRRAAHARLRDARAIVDRLEAAVLDAACDGRLTEDLRDSSNGETGVPAGWTRGSVELLAAPLPRAIQSGPFGSNLKHSEFQSNGKLVIGIDNVLDGEFSLGRQHRISERKFEELRRYEARPGDVLITVMATVGRVCVVPMDVEPAIITKHVYRITVDRQRVTPDFLALALRGHRTVREQIHYETRGQTRPGINGQIVKGLVVAIPPLDEQAAIVARASALLAAAARLRDRIDRCAEVVAAASRAAQSKAFRGELVPTEAALAEAEGRHFEPAEALLARVANGNPRGHLAKEKRARQRVSTSITKSTTSGTA